MPGTQTMFFKRPLPLHDISVLEIGGHISGPTASEDFARSGATVIKVEFGEGDPARRYLSEEGFNQFNAGKKNVVIYQKNSEVYAQLLRDAQVIIDNRSPEAKKRDAILQAFLQNDKAHPVIMCSIVGYDSDVHIEPALDVTVQAETGMAMTNAPIPDQPLKVGFVVIDIVTGMAASSAVKDYLILLSRGYQIPPEDKNVISLEVSMARMSATLQGAQFLHAYRTGQDQIRDYNRDNYVAPFSFYKTKDGSVALGIVSDSQFKKLCSLVFKRPDFIEKYPDNATRLRYRVALDAEIEKIMMTQDSNFWIDACKACGITCSRINTIKEAIARYGKDFFFTQTQQGIPIVRTPASSAHDGVLHSAPLLARL